MKIFLSIVFLFFVLNSFSKTKYNDTILTKLHGQGCGIIPNAQEVNYNINLLENLQKTDSNNTLIYRHLAMQYYFFWAREKDPVLKEIFRQKSIANNTKVLDLRQLKKFLIPISINNLLILYSYVNDCQNTKKYYALLKKRDQKFIDIGTLELLKKNCNL